MLTKEQLKVLQKAFSNASDFLRFSVEQESPYRIVITAELAIIGKDGTKQHWAYHSHIDDAHLHMFGITRIVPEVILRATNALARLLIHPGYDAIGLRSDWIAATDRYAIEVESYEMPIAYDDIEIG